MQGVVIAGTHSGCGKTTVTLGILAALKKKGLKVQSFKAGPDFIDSGLHRLITDRHSRNLDIWICGEDYVKECFYKHSADVDISVVEGVMGMYDGEFNTARLAGLINLPVILVVDAYGMAESAGAVVAGFAAYKRVKGSDTNLAGVIFNRVSSERHYERLKNSVCGIPVLGYLPRDLNFEIPHRHLGLTVAEENPITDENIQRLADAVLKHVNIEAILVMNDYLPLHSRKASKPSSEAAPARSSVRDTLGLPKSLQAIIHDSMPLKQKGDCPRFTGAAPVFNGAGSESGLSPTSAPKIAIAYDRAFCFYYEDNLDLLKEAGAEIIAFSPLSDSTIPDSVNAIYIGGGYPELYAKELSKNTSVLRSINDWADTGKPMYAECGGLMYLSQGIHGFDGNFFGMADVFPFETQIPPYPPLLKGGKGGLMPRLGYREIQLNDDCIIGKRGDKLRGHEFHYSSIVQQSNRATAKEYHNLAYALRNNNGERLSDEGYRYKNTLASYIHIHFGSNPDIAGNFINFIKENTWKT
jgi:cobyrinic acid a,c-diamide synthase